MQRDLEATRNVRQELSDLWRVLTFSNQSNSGGFTPEKFAATLQHPKLSIALDSDNICPELIIHVTSALKSRLRVFPSSCLRQLQILKILKRFLVVATPKPNK